MAMLVITRLGILYNQNVAENSEDVESYIN